MVMLETHVEVFAAGTSIKIWHKAALTTNSIVLQTSCSQVFLYYRIVISLSLDTFSKSTKLVFATPSHTQFPSINQVSSRTVTIRVTTMGGFPKVDTAEKNVHLDYPWWQHWLPSMQPSTQICYFILESLKGYMKNLPH